MIKGFQTCGDKGYFFARTLEVITISPFYSVVVRVLGGVPPFQWSVTGALGAKPFALAQASTQRRFNIISTTEHLIIGDSVEEITITDACGTETLLWVQCCWARECCKEEGYSFDAPETTIITQEKFVKIEAKRGCGPYTWAFVALDLELFANEDLLFASEDIFAVLGHEGGFQCMVTDRCGTVREWPTVPASSNLFASVNVLAVRQAAWLFAYYRVYGYEFLFPVTNRPINYLRVI